MPGSAMAVPLAGTPVDSSTGRPVMVNRMVVPLVVAIRHRQPDVRCYGLASAAK